MTIDVLIVGGGIGGAALARLLARGGKNVVVLEKNLTPPNLGRPEILWPSTVRLLRTLLPESELARWLLPVQGILFFERREIRAQISAEVFRSAGFHPSSTDPIRTRQLLLAGEGFELRRGVEVVGVLREGRRIVGVRARRIADGIESDIVARCTAGDDGPDSVIRRGCGIPLDTRPMPVELFAFGRDWPTAFPPAVVHAWFNPDRARAGVQGLGAIPLPDSRAAVLMFTRAGAMEAPDRTGGELRDLAAGAPGVAEILGGRHFPGGFARFRPRFGHASRYGAEGAVLLGDAAHPVTPAGGQGANMSVADAVALARCLLESNETRMLHDYEQCRRRANERSVSISRAASFAISLPDWATPGFPRIAGWVARWPGLAARILRLMSTRFQ